MSASTYGVKQNRKTTPLLFIVSSAIVQRKNEAYAEYKGLPTQVFPSITAHHLLHELREVIRELRVVVYDAGGAFHCFGSPLQDNERQKNTRLRNATTVIKNCADLHTTAPLSLSYRSAIIAHCMSDA